MKNTALLLSVAIIAALSTSIPSEVALNIVTTISLVGCFALSGVVAVAFCVPVLRIAMLKQAASFVPARLMPFYRAHFLNMGSLHQPGTTRAKRDRPTR
ncbi:hypothetical protein D3C87_466050 [compost metagenome]